MSRATISIDRPRGVALDAGPGESDRFARRLRSNIANVLTFIALYVVLITLWRSIRPHH